MSPNVKLPLGTSLMIPKLVQDFLGQTIRNVMGWGWGMGNFQAAWTFFLNLSMIFLSFRARAWIFFRVTWRTWIYFSLFLSASPSPPFAVPLFKEHIIIVIIIIIIIIIIITRVNPSAEAVLNRCPGHQSAATSSPGSSRFPIWQL